jgi:hypothetical protein
VNRVLGRVFGPNRDKIIGGCRKLHNEKPHFLHSSPIIRLIKFRRMTWGGHVVRMRTRGMHIEFWLESQKEKTARKT